MKHLKKITLPTYLTLLRLLSAPIVIPFLILYYVSLDDLAINIVVAGLFLALSFTDYLDGFFARRYNQVSKIGAALDHLADKFLTVSAFISLVAIGKMDCIPAVFLVCREFFMMGLREIGLQYNLAVVVSSWGKLKTALHTLLIVSIIINPYPLHSDYFYCRVEQVLLALSLVVSIGSALHYFIIFYKHLKKVDN